jgi:hypothetical protein
MTEYSVRYRCEAARKDGSRCMRQASFMTGTGWICRQHRDQHAGLLRRSTGSKHVDKRFPRALLP